MKPRLALQTIGKRFGSGPRQVTALDDISLTLAAGEFLAIQGPSGSGKSTLLNICGLIEAPSTGHYRLDGQAMETLSDSQRCAWRRRHIGFVFQGHQLLPSMTVFENIAYPLYLNGIRPREMSARTQQMMAAIGLAHRRAHLPRQLSGGEQQRVGVARALIKRPRLVIADEPSASLDHGNAHAVLMLMRTLNETLGASFLIASHDPFVIEHCDRRIGLLDGRLEPAP